MRGIRHEEAPCWKAREHLRLVGVASPLLLRGRPDVSSARITLHSEYVEPQSHLRLVGVAGPLLRERPLDEV
jgi:hypothetical protein